jgi:hypothetical protein
LIERQCSIISLHFLSLTHSLFLSCSISFDVFLGLTCRERKRCYTLSKKNQLSSTHDFSLQTIASRISMTTAADQPVTLDWTLIGLMVVVIVGMIGIMLKLTVGSCYRPADDKQVNIDKRNESFNRQSSKFTVDHDFKVRRYFICFLKYFVALYISIDIKQTFVYKILIFFLLKNKNNETEQDRDREKTS